MASKDSRCNGSQPNKALAEARDNRTALAAGENQQIVIDPDALYTGYATRLGQHRARDINSAANLPDARPSTHTTTVQQLQDAHSNCTENSIEDNVKDLAGQPLTRFTSMSREQMIAAISRNPVSWDMNKSLPFVEPVVEEPEASTAPPVPAENVESATEPPAEKDIFWNASSLITRSIFARQQQALNTLQQSQRERKTPAKKENKKQKKRRRTPPEVGNPSSMPLSPHYWSLTQLQRAKTIIDSVQALVTYLGVTKREDASTCEKYDHAERRLQRRLLKVQLFDLKDSLQDLFRITEGSIVGFVSGGS